MEIYGRVNKNTTFFPLKILQFLSNDHGIKLLFLSIDQGEKSVTFIKSRNKTAIFAK